MTQENDNEYIHHGIKKERGTLTQGNQGKDLFLSTLIEIIEKELSFIRTQAPRFTKLWNKFLVNIEPNPHNIRLFEFPKDIFLVNNNAKIEILKNLETSLIDGYYVIKSVVSTLYSKFFLNKELLNKYIKEEDQNAMIFLTSETLIGSLLQFLSTEKDIIPLKYLIIAQNKSFLRLKEVFDYKIHEKLIANSFNYSKKNVHDALDEVISLDYISKRSPSEQELKNEIQKGKEVLYLYKWNKDYQLSPEGEHFYKQNIFPILEWCVGLWRSMYNIREIDVVIPSHYKWPSYLEKTVKKAATQGFQSCYYVIKNIRKYYELIEEDKKKNQPQ